MLEPWKKVLSNTYLFTAAGVVVAALFAMASITLFPITSIVAYIVVLVIALVLVFAANATADEPIGLVLALLFFGTMGVLLSPQLATASSSAILMALGATSVIFVSLSAYVRWSKKDFSNIGGFLFVALIGLILVGVVNIFAQIPLLHTILSYVSILIFSGFILYDTSEVVQGRETNYVRASLNMFLNIINIFSSMLSLMDD